MNNKLSTGFCCALAFAAVSSSAMAAIVPTVAPIRHVANASTTITPSSPYADFTATLGSNYQHSTIAADGLFFDGIAVNGNSRFAVQFTATETKDYGFGWSFHHAIDPSQDYAAGGYAIQVFRNGINVGKTQSLDCCQSPRPWSNSGSGAYVIHFEAGDTGSVIFEAQSDAPYYSVSVNGYFAEVTSVPVPASLPLLGSALASLALGRRIRAKRKH